MVLVGILIVCCALIAVALLVAAMVLKSPGLVFFAVLVAVLTILLFTQQILRYLSNVLP